MDSKMTSEKIPIHDVGPSNMKPTAPLGDAQEPSAASMLSSTLDHLPGKVKPDGKKQSASQTLFDILARSSGKGALSSFGESTGNTHSGASTQTTVQTPGSTFKLQTEPSARMDEMPIIEDPKTTDKATPASLHGASNNTRKSADQVAESSYDTALSSQKNMSNNLVVNTSTKTSPVSSSKSDGNGKSRNKSSGNISSLQEKSCEQPIENNLVTGPKTVESEHSVVPSNASPQPSSIDPKSVATEPPSQITSQTPETPAEITINFDIPKHVQAIANQNCSETSVSRPVPAPPSPSDDSESILDQALSSISPDSPQIDPSQIDSSSQSGTSISSELSETEWERLWDMCWHSEGELKSIGIPTLDHGLLPAEATGNWCEQCRKCTDRNEDEPNRKKLQSHETRMRAGAAQAKMYFRKNQRPRLKPGRIGDVKEHVYDTWDPAVRLDTIYWTQENIDRFVRDEEKKFHERRTEWGCWGHKGRLVGSKKRTWTCCRRGEEIPGCFVYEGHKYIERDTLQAAWQLYKTPTNKPADFRQAVVVSCQMGKNTWGQDELIKIAVLDYFSGEVLIDKLVWPSVELWHTDRWVTGIEMVELERAHHDNSAIEGRDAARELLHRFVGDETAIIVHDGRRNLLALRLTHCHVVDVKYMANDNPRLDLETMAERHLGRPSESNSTRSTLDGAQTCQELVRHFLEI